MYKPQQWSKCDDFVRAYFFKDHKSSLPADLTNGTFKIMGHNGGMLFFFLFYFFLPYTWIRLSTDENCQSKVKFAAQERDGKTYFKIQSAI